ncbi:hypothetical protein HU200_000561 [Digitaria exilis]|uniref:Scarecrow-like protein 9 n=1 Tax=Digitaria exilis TaxID=1010633 RepID=A0A835KYC2_9POAL|nr:hypothetical protein HU200_000561 [Digitaria exilis]
MATTPEEFFTESLMKPSPPSPSIFLELPRTPDDSHQGFLSHADLMLRYISHKLIEEDIEEKNLCQYSNHPALLEAEQSFAEILSPPSFGANNVSNIVNMGIIEGANELLQGDQITLNPTFSKDVDAVEQFFKGMEEAHRFLPAHSFKMNEQVNQMFRDGSNHSGINKRDNRDEHPEQEAGKARKSVMIREELKQIGIHDMLDGTTLHGYETYIRDMEKLRIDEVVTDGKTKRTKVSSKKARDMVDLSTLLIRCAREMAMENYMMAAELLQQIKQHASATGDATQRLAQCFAKGLEARLVGKGMQLWKLLMVEHPIMDILNAYKALVTACCLDTVSFNFYSMTIMNAMVGKRRLHIVDYGMHFGFQWAGLMHCLANRDGPPPEVKITVIRRAQLRIYPSQQIEEQWCQLRKCATELGLPFKLHVITKKMDEVCIKDLSKDIDEVLVVTDLCHFSSLTDESIFFDYPSPRDTVLGNIRKMRPDVFIQSIVNSSYGSSFLSRFREALSYYMALFDMLDATMPRDSEPRLVLEQGLLGRCALNSIACEGVNLVYRPEKYSQWQARNQRAGLRQLPLKQNIVEVLKDKVKHRSHKDSFITEDNQWLLQGWMGRILFAHSTWVAEEAIS